MGIFLARFGFIVKCAIGLLFAELGVAFAVTMAVALLLADNWEEVWNNTKGEFFRAICGIARQKTGIELMPDAPFSDASFAAAITLKSGINITTVKDVEIMKRDLSAHASGIVKGHTGIELTNLFSVEQIKTDVVGHASKVVYDRTGLDIQGAVSYDDVQKKIYKAVENRLAELVVQRLKAAAEEFANPEATLDDLLSMVYRAQEAKNLKMRDVALGAAASIVVAAYATISTPMKRRIDAYRKRAQNREAQRRFRQRHGLRMRYDRLRPVPPAPTGG